KRSQPSVRKNPEIHIREDSLRDAQNGYARRRNARVLISAGTFSRPESAARPEISESRPDLVPLHMPPGQRAAGAPNFSLPDLPGEQPSGKTPKIGARSDRVSLSEASRFHETQETSLTPSAC